MFLHEIMKGADPSHLAFTGEVDVTYGALEDAIHRYRNAIYALGVREGERGRPPDAARGAGDEYGTVAERQTLAGHGSNLCKRGRYPLEKGDGTTSVPTLRGRSGAMR